MKILIALISDTMQRLSNHPVHVYDKDGEISPSAFIPFCAYGDNMTAMAIMQDSVDRDIELPVCNTFVSKIHNNELCYEVDLYNYNYDTKEGIEKELDLGLVFFMDYNEDRQVIMDEDIIYNHKGFVEKVDASKDDEKASIYLSTIGD